MPRILIVDDEKSIRETLKEILLYESYEVEEAEDGKKAFDMIKKFNYDAVLCDIKMPGMDGIELLDKAAEIVPELPFIMISGHGTIETALEATKKGAFDFISKPPDLNKLLITVRNATEKNSLVIETKVLKRKITKTREMIGESPSIKKIKDTIDKVAPTDARVLITGENGTGKELVARWIHERSNRVNEAFVEVNCAAIPSELIESELFGHEKGSFTSAVKQRLGKFEKANNGTLFLDEIGDMSLSAQAKVLRALQENKITRVGGEKDIDVNVRIVAATNKDLRLEIEEGRFREDLYHRISVILIHVPSLNDRTDDIPLIAEKFITEICEDNGMPRKTLAPSAMQELKKINWTGNIRELRNVCERLIILCDDKITGDDVLNFSNAASRRTSSLDVVEQFEKFQDFKDHAEKVFIDAKLKKNKWNVAKTATEIDIQRSHLYNKIEKYGLKRKQNKAMIGADVSVAAELLQSGKLVAIPTETVYGLAANAFNSQAVLNIFKAKNRPSFDPLIVHIASFDWVKRLATVFPPKAQLLAETFWPGSLTIILPKTDLVPDVVTSGLPFVGLRMPNHSTTLELLSQLDFPLAAPSANPFGYVSPTTASHVADQLGDKMDYILDGGACKIGVESTIVSFEDPEKPVILRFGGISVEQIEAVVGTVSISISNNSNPAAPGQLDKHYATKKIIELVNSPELLWDVDQHQHYTIGYGEGHFSFNLSPTSNLDEIASNLFVALRLADQASQPKIVVSLVTESGIGRAINDRLRRAAAR